MSLRAAPHILFFRHSPVIQSGLCYGQSTQETQHQASAVAERFLSAYAEWCALQRSEAPHLVKRPITLWSSPAPRCQAPARLIAEGLGCPLRVDHRLYELSFGAWEGRAWSELEASEPEALQRWMDNWKTVAPPGGEDLPSFEARVVEWRAQLEGEALHILIGHAGIFRALMVNLQLKTWEEAMSLAVSHLELLHLSTASS